ncbi:MAG: carbon-monoxide dehydrogenase medium subunit [Chloroflexi bacterium]|jgi:carbon-monoxide dehydrogenase medium subunit|nr:MAG: carbon-monoxide dehydrogenase medium subunit [Chloroflexota bacterium]
MKPAVFDYHAPAIVQEAVELLQRYGEDATVLAGGQSLVPLMNLRLSRPGHVVDLNGVPELDYLTVDGEGIVVGATTRQRTLERSDTVRDLCPLLWRAMPLVGHFQVRNRGTVGGSLAHADPASELPAVALVLQAEVGVVGPTGRRDVKAEDFFIDAYTTALDSAEIVEHVRFPSLPGGTGTAILEVARREGDFAMAGVAASLTLDPEGLCSSARLALFGVGPTPVRVIKAERILEGRAITEELVGEAAAMAVQDLDPSSDVHASAAYRKRVAGVLVRRAIAEALARATGEQT